MEKVYSGSALERFQSLRGGALVSVFSSEIEKENNEKVVESYQIFVNNVDTEFLNTLWTDFNIHLIKQKAGEIINSKYSDIQQRNILMSLDTESIQYMNAFISSIRFKSDEAELNNIELGKINWEINNG